MLPDVFDRFKWYSGPVKHRFYPSPIGAMMDQAFNYSEAELAHLPFDGTWNFERAPPVADEEVFEWADVLETVESARGCYTMIELGAGFGRWLVNAALACRQRELPFHLVGVEAEPRHFQWLRQHLGDNGIDPGEHTLIQAPISGRQESVRFYIGEPQKWYGQAITAHAVSELDTAEIIDMQAITLSEVLDPLDRVDLIDIDIQGAEFDVLATAEEALMAKVRRLHVGTHGSDIEASLRSMFSRLGWRKLYDFGAGTTCETPCGAITFGDGVQTWSNPGLD